MTSTIKTWTAIIPVRGGSKGLLGKNTRLLSGKPLYLHAVTQALEAGASRVVITTDIAEIINCQPATSVEILPRPAELCTDDAVMTDVLLHAIEARQLTGTLVLMQATSPLRSVASIRAALSLFTQGRFSMVMAVTEAERHALKWGMLQGGAFIPLSKPEYCFANRQSLPSVMRPNGAIYVVDAEQFLRNAGFPMTRIGAIEMPLAESYDIDTLQDFERCEAQLLSLAHE